MKIFLAEDVVQPRLVRPLYSLVARRQQRPVLRLQQRLGEQPSLVAQHFCELAEAIVRVPSFFLQCRFNTSLQRPKMIKNK